MLHSGPLHVNIFCPMTQTPAMSKDDVKLSSSCGRRRLTPAVCYAKIKMVITMMWTKRYRTPMKCLGVHVKVR